MKLRCPNCEAMRVVEPYDKTLVINVKGEPIEVKPNLYRCLECNELILPEGQPNELELAYQEYRKRHNLLTPEDIKEIRKTYGLSQQDLSNLTGIGIATINRYENGSLQNTSHDTILSLLKNPYSTKALLDKNKDKFSKEKIAQITSKLYELYKQNNLETIDLIFKKYSSKSDRSFSLERLINLISTLAHKSVKKNIDLTKTKLNKLLFYIDFLNFKNYGESITGAVYAHLPYGPCLESYDMVISSLIQENIINIKEVINGDRSYESLIPKKDPENVFTKKEEKLIDQVFEKLSILSAAELSDLSHKEKAYSATKNGEIIDYEYAHYLEVAVDV